MSAGVTRRPTLRQALLVAPGMQLLLFLGLARAQPGVVVRRWGVLIALIVSGGFLVWPKSQGASVGAAHGADETTVVVPSAPSVAEAEGHATRLGGARFVRQAPMPRPPREAPRRRVADSQIRARFELRGVVAIDSDHPRAILYDKQGKTLHVLELGEQWGEFEVVDIRPTGVSLRLRGEILDLEI